MIEVMDEKTGKGTGKYKPVVEMPDVDATTGEQVVMTRTPEEAVKRMKELPEMYGNLFRSGVVSGIGSSSATGGLASGAGGKIDVKNLTPSSTRKSVKRTLSFSDCDLRAAANLQGCVRWRLYATVSGNVVDAWASKVT